MSAVRKEGVSARRFAAANSVSSAVPTSETPADSRFHNSAMPRRASLMQEPVLVLNRARVVRADRVGRESGSIRAFLEGAGDGGQLVLYRNLCFTAVTINGDRLVTIASGAIEQHPVLGIAAGLSALRPFRME